MVPQAQSPWYIHDIQLIGILECPPEPHLRTQWSLYSYSLSSWGDAWRTSCSWRCSVWVLGMPAKPTCSDQISNCCVAWICPCPSISIHIQILRISHHRHSTCVFCISPWSMLKPTSFCSTPPTKTEAAGKAQFESAATSDLIDHLKGAAPRNHGLGGWDSWCYWNCFWLFMELAPASAKSDAMEIASRAWIHRDKRTFGDTATTKAPILRSRIFLSHQGTWRNSLFNLFGQAKSRDGCLTLEPGSHHLNFGNALGFSEKPKHNEY